VTIGAARGRFSDELRARTWQLELLDVARPRDVTLELGHRTVRLTSHGIRRAWTYNAAARTLTISTGPLATSHTATISTR
jgi:hypothetical protein